MHRWPAAGMMKNQTAGPARSIILTVCLSGRLFHAEKTMARPLQAYGGGSTNTVPDPGRFTNLPDTEWDIHGQVDDLFNAQFDFKKTVQPCSCR